MSALDREPISTKPDAIKAKSARRRKATSRRSGDVKTTQGSSARETKPQVPARRRSKGKLPSPSRPTAPEVRAGARPLAIVPRSMSEALDLARAVVAARLAPRGLETAEACMVAILHGLEVGLTPMAALQRIAVIDGRPTIWGDGALALVRASGLLVSISETISGETEVAWLATCRVLRRGDADPIERCFGVADARRAGLWGRPGPWQEHPRRMLQMRARAFALRDAFPDVLGGLYLREEIEEAPRALAPPPPPFPEAPASTATAANGEAAATAETSPDEHCSARPPAKAAVQDRSRSAPKTAGHGGYRGRTATSRTMRAGQARRTMQAPSPARGSPIWRPLGKRQPR